MKFRRSQVTDILNLILCHSDSDSVNRTLEWREEESYEKLKNVSIVTCLFLLLILVLSFATAAILTLISVLTTFLIKSVMYVCTLYAVIKQATSALW